MSSKSRIQVSPGQPPLQNPFSELRMSGLKKGPAEEPTRKGSSPKMGRVVIRRETASRGGKTVTVIGGFAVMVSDDQIEDLGRELRQVCGCGGTVKDREIELQGEHAPQAAEFFQGRGFQTAGVTDVPGNAR